jgi:hypothetical protein
VNQWKPENYFSMKSEIVYWDGADNKQHMAERDVSQQ